MRRRVSAIARRYMQGMWGAIIACAIIATPLLAQVITSDLNGGLNSPGAMNPGATAGWAGGGTGSSGAGGGGGGAGGGGGSASPGTLVAVAEDPTTAGARSVNSGTTWAGTTLPSSSAWSAITYNANTTTWVAIANGATAVSTNDGVSWTGATLTVPSVSYFSIANNGTIYCATPQQPGAANYFVISSTDTTTWTQHTITGNGFAPDVAGSVVWTGTQFVLLGFTTTSGTPTPVMSVAATSPDCATWTSQVVPTPTGGIEWFGLAWNGSIVCGGGFNSANFLSTNTISSPDGVTWTSHITTTGVTGAMTAHGTTFCGVGGSAAAFNLSSTSTDCATWTSGTLAVSGGAFGMAYDGVKYVTPVSGSASANGSTDCINWTAQTMPASHAWSDIGGHP